MELSDHVPGLFGHEKEDIGAYVTSSEGRQAPVGFDGGYLREVIVEVVVGGSDKILGDSVAEKKSEHIVWISISSDFVKS